MEGAPEATKAIGGQIQATSLKQEVKRIDLSVLQTLGTDWTGKLGKNTFVNHLNLEANMAIASPQAQLAVFLEGGDKLPPKYAYKLTVNGMDFALNPIPSKTKTMTYNVSHIHGPHWIFLTTELPLSRFMLQAKNKINLEVLGGDDCTKMSVWVWTMKKGGTIQKYPNALPSPESVSLDGAGLAEVKF
jgi:hypothetical protein